MNTTPSLKWPLTPLWAGILAASTLSLAAGSITVIQSGALRDAEPEVTLPTPHPQVSALGRIEPEAEVIRVAAPASLEGDRLAQLRVKLGDLVQTGQVLAILDSYNQRQANLVQAQQDVKVARAQLAQIRAGAKLGEITAQQAMIRQIQVQQQGNVAAQQATLTRIEAELANAQAEYQRYQSLFQEGAVSQSLLDSKRLSLNTTRAQVDEAKVTLTRLQRSSTQEILAAQGTLSRIAEVRPVDVMVAQAEVDRAQAAVLQAERQLEQTVIRSPQSGKVLKIHTRPGEQISANGLVDLADTTRMVVVAEVYQTDIGRIRLGQPAQISSPTFRETISGTVTEVGLQVERQNVFSNEPGENLDQRIVEVKIRLDPSASQQVAGMTNLQVDTTIQVNPS